MNYTKKKIPWDLVSAALTLILGGLVATYSTREVMAGSQSSIVALGQIPSGETHYQVWQDDKCVGNLRTNLMDDEITAFQVTGNILLKEIGQIKLRSLTMVNPLNQLVSSENFVEAAESQLNLNVQGVEQLKLSAGGIVAGKEWERHAVITGPMLVSMDKNNFWFVSLPPGVSLPGGFSGVWDNILKPGFLLVARGPTACVGDSLHPLDTQRLDPLINIIRRFSDE